MLKVVEEGSRIEKVDGGDAEAAHIFEFIVRGRVRARGLWWCGMSGAVFPAAVEDLFWDWRLILGYG